MELSFIISAMRRRFWLIILFTIIGGIVGTAVSRSSENNEFEATSALLVRPPESVFGGTVISNDADRYVLGQQRVLEGLDIAEDVAAKLPGETAGSVRQDVNVTHRAETDILEITVRSESPERARDIANAYTEAYIGRLTASTSTDPTAGLSGFASRVEEIKVELAEKAEALTASLDAERRANPNITPQGDQLLVVEIQYLNAELGELQRQLIDSQARSFNRVTSQIVENAVLPTTTIATSSRLYLFAGLLGGFAVGIVAAILAARLSTKVLDRYEAETVLNQPMTGELVHAGGLTRSRAAALYELPSALEQVISRVCARAQANAVDDRPLVVAVVGTQRNAGTTTLALAMAGRFARTDFNSVIVDFDSHDPELTRLFAQGTGGIPTVLSYLSQPSTNGPTSAHNRGRRIDPTTIFASTPSERVRIIGSGGESDTLALRRSEITRILEFAARDVEVVICDAGSLPDAAAAEQLVRIADCVVVAVPLKKLRASTLDTTARLLSGRSELILPVITHPGRSKFSGRGSAASRPPASATPDLEDAATGR